jgi:hypothetical protein
MVTKAQNPKVRRILINIATFVGNMAMWSLNFFKNMESLEETINKHNIHIYSSSSSSHGLALFASRFSFNATSTSPFNEWLIDSGVSYHMGKDKSIFPTLNEFNTKKIYFGEYRSLIVVGFGTI